MDIFVCTVRVYIKGQALESDKGSLSAQLCLRPVV